jgi:ribosome-binding factor A
VLQARDPRLASVTITGVEISPDLLQAKVYYSVLGDDEAEREAQLGLDHASGFLRTELAGRVQLRFVPELRFVADSSAAYAQRIEELLDQLDQEGNAQHE